MKKYFILILAIIFIGEGISEGGMADTLKKANKICLECIGIG